MTIYSDTIAENLSLHPAIQLGQATIVPEGLHVSQLADVIRARQAAVAENLTLAPALTSLVGVSLIENLAIRHSQVVNSKFHLTMAEQATFAAQVSSAWPVTVAETMTFTAAHIVQAAVTVMEQLQITPQLTPAVLYHMTIAERITVADALARFLSASVIENLLITPAISAQAFKAAQVNETLTLHDALTPLFILRVTCSETLELTADQAVKMIFSAEVDETIEIAGAYVGPNGSVTTWVMNTRTGGVTEYQNYAFNSFARVGNKYLGASENGLYELLGDKDDGTSIIATIRSGFAQWAGTHLGSFKAAYLAISGPGAYVLQIITRDGKTYNYNVVAADGSTAKIPLGKGLRSRYFAFELVSSGQDFDFDTLEFVPLVADRRV